MSEELAQVLQTSEEPRELVPAAIQLARSDQPQNHEVVLRALRSEKFLGCLNTEQEYHGKPERLRVRRIFDELAKNKAESAHNTLLELTKSAAFAKKESRLVVLIQATAVIRPAPPELISFWEKYSGPEEGFMGDIIEAALENGSRPALEFFEKKTADLQYDEDVKFPWLHSSVLIRRHQARLLGSCERLLASELPQEVKSELVDTLFDYKPGEWFTASGGYNPPPLAAYSASARAMIRRIADGLLKTDWLTRGQREAVEKMLRELEAGSQSGESGGQKRP